MKSRLKQGIFYLLSPFVLFGCASNAISPKISFSEIEEFRHSKNKSLSDIAFFIDRNFKDKKDPGFLCFRSDYWQSPRETIKKGTCDCEDSAILASYLAENLGYKPLLLTLADSFVYCHTVALLYHETLNKYGSLGKCEYVPPEYETIDGLISEGINKISSFEYDSYIVYDLDKISPNWRTQNKNLTQKIPFLKMKKVKRQ